MLYQCKSLRITALAIGLVCLSRATAGAHQFSVTWAEVTVTKEKVSAEVRVLAEDFLFFQGAKLNAENYVEPDELRAAMQRHAGGGRHGGALGAYPHADQPVPRAVFRANPPRRVEDYRHRTAGGEADEIRVATAGSAQVVKRSPLEV